MLIRKKNKFFDEERLPIRHLLFVGILPGFLKKAYYRLKGYKIDKNVSLGFFTIILGEKITIKNNVKIGHFTIIKGKEIVIGAYSEIDSFVYISVPHISIGEDVIIREQVKIGGNETHKSFFSIGDRSHIRQNVLINTSEKVVIGNETAIGGGTYIFTHSSWHSFLEGYPCTYAPVIIGNNVWISWDSFILPKVSVSDDVLIGAGSVVTKNIPPNCIAMGNPAQVVIPSGKYKREIDYEDRIYFFNIIIEQYFDYLKFKGFVFEFNKNEELWEMIFNLSGQIKKIIFIFDSSVFINKKADCYVILTGNSFDYSKFHEIDSMIIDLDLYNRFGSNEIGESLTEFLLKYGIKLERKDEY